jgi:hypothetical protein
MTQWARQRGDFLAEWHLLGEPRQTGAGTVGGWSTATLEDTTERIEP